MDEYTDPVHGVDEALRRLHATLDSYQVAVDPPHDLVPEEVRAGGHVSTGGGRHGSVNAADATSGGFDSIWKDVLKLRSIQPTPEITRPQLQSSLSELRSIIAHVVDRPYCLPLHILHSQRCLALGYPDLAAGAAYKALLLSDAVQDAADEYHDRACAALHEVVRGLPLVDRIALLKAELNAHGESRTARSEGDEPQADIEVSVWLREHYLPLIYRLLVRSTFLCGSYRSAGGFMQKALELYSNDHHLQVVRRDLEHSLSTHSTNPIDVATSGYSHLSTWPEKGYARRELYPWNDLNPDRLSELPALNTLMSEVAPKLEVRAVELPVLTDGGEKVVTQLGVFAKEDIAAGEVVLDETSMLTANNKLQDALCDACSADLPDLSEDAAQAVTSCPQCEVVFCSEECFERAANSYHPIVCGTDVEAIAKDVPPAEAADSLYALLLLRALAMATVQQCHPLNLKEVKYIWGDFHNLPLAEHWRPPSLTSPSDASAGLPRTLPFTFEHNVRLPFHMLEKMDLDIFAHPAHDVWVFNTLYAKFRGTASARLSGLVGGRAVRGPEVSAVHPMWCLANHACDPNVDWEWGGSVKFWARRERVVWGGEEVRNRAGIGKDEEVLNHYCDVDLPVRERREWARGALGGDCMCARCVWEAGEEA